jgi:cholesterol transport system auxiliary component
LRERIAYRDAAYEVGYYEDQRWTERPEIYVRRELTRTLFEERGFRRVLGGVAPTLDVEVLAFDELRLPMGRAARVELKVVLFEDRNVIWEETLTVDRSVATSTAKIEDVVAAMAEALDVAAEQVATRVAAAIAARPQTGRSPTNAK